MKLAWVVVGGSDAALRRRVLARAHIVADAVLSAATPVQRALPLLLDAAEAIQPRIRARLHANLLTLQQTARNAPWSVLAADGGWTALVRLPQGIVPDDEAWARALLERGGVLTNPGYLFDADPSPPLVALSLLAPRETITIGAAAITETVVAVLA